MTWQDLIHPRLLTDLFRFFASNCTIQRATQSADTYRSEVLTYANLAGHVSIPCIIAPTGGQEIKAPNMTYVVASHHVTLAGYYPNIREKDRAIIGTMTLDILIVECDSQAETTRLICQIVD